jgi:hypothetical protein
MTASESSFNNFKHPPLSNDYQLGKLHFPDPAIFMCVYQFLHAEMHTIAFSPEKIYDYNLSSSILE